MNANNALRITWGIGRWFLETLIIGLIWHIIWRIIHEVIKAGFGP